MKRFRYVAIATMLAIFALFIMPAPAVEAAKTVTIKHKFDYIQFDFKDVEEPMGNEVSLEFKIPKKLKDYQGVIWGAVEDALEGRRAKFRRESEADYRNYEKIKAGFIKNAEKKLKKAKKKKTRAKIKRKLTKTLTKHLEGFVNGMKRSYDIEKDQMKSLVQSSIELSIVKIKERKLVKDLDRIKDITKTVKIVTSGTFKGIGNLIGIAVSSVSLAVATGPSVAGPIVAILGGVAATGLTIAKTANDLRVHIVDIRNRDLNDIEIARGSIDAALDKVDQYKSRFKKWKKIVKPHFALYKKASKSYEKKMRKLESKSAKMQKVKDKLERQLAKAKKKIETQKDKGATKKYSKIMAKYKKIDSEAMQLNRHIAKLNNYSDDCFKIEKTVEEYMKAKKFEAIAGSISGLPDKTKFAREAIGTCFEISKNLASLGQSIAKAVQ